MIYEVYDFWDKKTIITGTWYGVLHFLKVMDPELTSLASGIGKFVVWPTRHLVVRTEFGEVINKEEVAQYIDKAYTDKKRSSYWRIIPKGPEKGDTFYTYGSNSFKYRETPVPGVNSHRTKYYRSSKRGMKFWRDVQEFASEDPRLKFHREMWWDNDDYRRTCKSWKNSKKKKQWMK